jgi:putative NADH-flavin reductase
MNITIFGANGAIGRIVTEQALRSGASVTAYVRRADSLGEILERVRAVVGELTDEPLIESAVKDADIVISALGPALDYSRRRRGTPIADGHELIIRAMETFGVKRFITLATPSIRSADDNLQVCTVLPAVTARLLFPNAYRDMKKIQKLILSSSLDWTVVRIINPNVKHTDNRYHVSLGSTPARMGVSRENAAAFIWSAAADGLYIRQMPIVFNL